MALETSTDRCICCRCGKQYPKLKPYFPVSYAQTYKGVGHLPICRDCLEQIYNGYLLQCGNPKAAVRQTCRKLDIYWNESAFDYVERRSTPRSLIMQYMTKINSAQYAGRSYDDTLKKENSLWQFPYTLPVSADGSDEQTVDGSYNAPESAGDSSDSNPVSVSLEDIPEEVMSFWGPGYTPDMYEELEQRRKYWMSRPGLEELDVGGEALIRQICCVEIDINRDRLAKKPVDKYINTLNTLIGSLNLKPTQKKEDTSSFESKPMGVWIQKFEEGQPIPEVDPELEDVDGLKKYIFTWVFGHLCKMLGVKNSYSKLYEAEMSAYRVEHPEYDDEDDNSLLDDIFGGEDS